MQLLFIVDDYLPHSIKVAAKMMHELALDFTSKGHNITVLTPVSDQKEMLVIKEIEGINILFFRSGKIKNISKIQRARNETLLSWHAWKAAKKYFRSNHFNGIVYYSPSIFWGPLVGKLKKMWSCNSYLILRDIFPQWTVDNGIMKKYTPIYFYFKFFEWINYRSAGRIGVMSPSNLEFFKNTKTNTSKFEVLYNWAITSHLEISKNIYRKKLNLENKVVFFYGGNIGHAQKMIYLINLAKQFQNNTNVHFLFVGVGDEVDVILREIEAFNLSNVTYLSSVDQEIYFKMLSDFDIGLFSLHPDHKTHNFPGKLLGYMAYAKPILGCVNLGNDLKQIINDAEAGIVVNSGDEVALFKAATLLVESETKRKEMGLNGKQLLSNQFSLTKACNQIEQNLLLK